MIEPPRRAFIVEHVKRRAGAPPLQKVQPVAAVSAGPLRLEDELEALAARVRQIRAVGRNGDASPFYEDRSQAARDCADLASWQRKGVPPAGYVPAAQRDRPDPRIRYGERH